MEANLYYTRGWVLRRYIKGPLASHINPFSEFLAKQGYAYATGQRYVREVGHLSQWLDQKRVGLEHLNHEVINGYCRSRGSGMRSRLKKGPYLQLLKYLRQNNIIKTPDPASTPIDECLGQYRDHLIKSRGLSEDTIRGRIRYARYFLALQFGTRDLEFQNYCPKILNDFYLIGHAIAIPWL